jgi:hypothetical protein
VQIYDQFQEREDIDETLILYSGYNCFPCKYHTMYSETSIYRSQMYRFPGSIVQFLRSLSESYLNYGNKTGINRLSIYCFPASIGQNF